LWTRAGAKGTGVIHAVKDGGEVHPGESRELPTGSQCRKRREALSALWTRAGAKGTGVIHAVKDGGEVHPGESRELP